MIVCIGAFDGYHRGHFSLFERARSLSRGMDTDWALVTFEPHPRFVLGGLKARLFSPAEKAFLRRCFGLPEPVEIPFTHEFANTEPQLFLDELRARVPLEGVVVGSDFRFGRGRTGDGDFLRGYCEARGLSVALVPQLTEGGSPVSSSRVRSCVENGDLEEAKCLLGYPFFIRSQVVTGQRRGRTLGFPTANLTPGEYKLIPAEGVYAGSAWADGGWRAAAVSVGRNPTFGGEADVRLEAHLLDFHGDLYGRELFLTLFERLRPMERFSGAAELAAQMERDCERARAIFAGARPSLGVFPPDVL
ncbi:MAG: riboflavin biosynthesis protein RibF [Pyramidobacter sp.]|nr:riboflavin biosynthesis protein RibF [Pyramidobacter sp.]